MIISYIKDKQNILLNKVDNVVFIADNTKIVVNSNCFTVITIIPVKDLNWIKPHL